MLEHEVKVYKAIAGSMERAIKPLVAIMKGQLNYYKYWADLASLVSFATAQAYDFVELQDDEDTLLSVWGKKSSLEYKGELIYEFFNVEIVEGYVKEHIAMPIDALAIPDEVVEPLNRSEYNTIKNLFSILNGDDFAMVIPVLLLSSQTRSLKIHTRDSITHPYLARDLHEDIQRVLSDKASLVSLVGVDYIEDFERQCNNLKSLLYKDGSIYILGRDPELQEAIMSYRVNKPSSMSSSINKASGTKPDVAEPDYYEMAREYLKGVNYIQDEEEIEGILESHFISRTPAEAYRVITQTF